MRTILQSRTLAVTFVAVIVACTASVESGESQADVTLRVEPTDLSAGDSVTLVLGNDAAGPIGYNLCTSSLERQTAGTWEAVPSDRVCTMELRTVEPGAEARYPLDLPAALEPGEYRYATNVEMMGAGESEVVRSDPFTVE